MGVTMDLVLDGGKVSHSFSAMRDDPTPVVSTTTTTRTRLSGGLIVRNKWNIFTTTTPSTTTFPTTSVMMTVDALFACFAGDSPREPLKITPRMRPAPTRIQVVMMGVYYHHLRLGGLMPSY